MSPSKQNSLEGYESNFNPNNNRLTSSNSQNQLQQQHNHPSSHNNQQPQQQQQYCVGQDPNKIREKILSEFLRKRLRKCGITETFKEIRHVSSQQRGNLNSIRNFLLNCLFRSSWIRCSMHCKLFKSIVANDTLWPVAMIISTITWCPCITNAKSS